MALRKKAKSQDKAPPESIQKVSPLPKGHESLAAEVRQRMFFTTSTGDAIRQFNPREVTHSRGPSFSFLTAHQGWQRSQVPMIDRTSCSYTSEFVQKPMDMLEVTNQMKDLFAKKAVAGETTTVPPGTKLATETSFKHFFGNAAKPGGPEQSFKPSVQVHVDPKAKFMVSCSTFNRDFKPIDGALARNAIREPSVPPGDSVCRSIAALEYETSYRRDYGKGKSRRHRQSRSVPSLYPQPFIN